MEVVPLALETLMTVRQVAKLSQTSEYTIRRMCRLKELPARRIGNAYRIPASAVQELTSGMLEQSAAPTSATA
jgi:excisionase family DNA binding protein